MVGWLVSTMSDFLFPKMCGFFRARSKGVDQWHWRLDFFWANSIGNGFMVDYEMSHLRTLVVNGRLKSYDC